MNSIFEDRADAGEKLAEYIDEKGIEPDIVLAIPRGGLPLGRKVADHFDAPLSVVVARKMGAPGNPELAIGAVSAEGSVWLNDDLIERLEIDKEYIEDEKRKQVKNAKNKLERFQVGPLNLEGKTVVVVDDGVATGATARASMRQVKDEGASEAVLAVPVAPSSVVNEMRQEADVFLAMETPSYFDSVGSFYRNFEQVSDDEAADFLRVEKIEGA